MTQEEKDLLLKDLSARLPYGVYVQIVDRVGFTHTLVELKPEVIQKMWSYKSIKPYLRPMDSMTEEEKKEYQSLCVIYGDHDADDNVTYYYFDTVESFDWLNKNMFDYRDLIPKDLAIEVTKENNPYKN